MKISIFLFILCFCSFLPGSAQQFKRVFLFDDFVQAQIQFRNRSVSVVSLNYDASNKTMLFRQGVEMMEMTNSVQVDTIVIGKRKFVPSPKGFYEVVYMKNGIAYIDWLLKDVTIGSKGALGAVTQGSVQNLQMSDLGLNATEMYTPYERQQKGSMEVYRRKNDNTYYIKMKKELVKIKTVKHLEKVFAPHKEEIKAYVKGKDINMKNVRDALSVLDYCMGLAQ